MSLKYWKLHGWRWAIPEKKTNRRFKYILFWKTPMKFSGYLLYSWKFQTKQSFTQETSQNSATLLKAQNQDTEKFHMIFSWSPLEIPHFFCITPGNFTCYFFNTLEIPHPELSPFVFFSGIAYFKNELFN